MDFNSLFYSPGLYDQGYTVHGAGSLGLMVEELSQDWYIGIFR